MSVAFFLVGLVAAQSGMITNSSSPPPIIAATPSPMPPTVGNVSAPYVVVPIHVRIAAGNEILFSDTLRVAQNGGANFDQNRSEAPAGPCPANRSYGYGNRQSLRVQLYYLDAAQNGPSVRVTVNWQRPSSTADCSSEGSRTVAVSETVPLQLGQTASIRGDGGLIVTLSRR